MRLSKYFFHTLKESPSDAEIESHRLLIRANFIKKLAPGLYSYLPMGLRSVRKFENIVREEMNRAGAIEILMAMVQPRELWDESGRWEVMGKGMLKMKDRNDHELCIGPTHEEVVTDIARREVKSYRDLPLNLYQIQTKFRDEVRPRFGLMRGKEFIMKDAYSFDVDKEAALKSYEAMFNAYKRIFFRCGLDFRTVRADSGAIGGSHTHEFQVLASSGEDQIMACTNCDYASNVEITPAQSPTNLDGPHGLNLKEHIKSLGLKVEGERKIHTPNLKTIDDLEKFLKIPAHNLVKTLFYKIADKKFLCILIRGDEELNEIKLKNLYDLKMPPEMAREDEVLAITGGAHPGSCGPVGLQNIAVICDNSLKNLKDWIVGANQDDYHLFNVNPDTDFKVARWADLRKAREGDLCPECKTGTLKSHRGIEVGHVFYLGDKYSKSMKAVFLDENSKSRNCEMGCYGIGIGRTVQAAIEQSHDKDGMIWPLPLAPFEVLICLLDVDDAETKGVAEKIYAELLAKGVEVLLDDRNERPGIKFKDADLIGIPFRINVGKKSLTDGGQVEVIDRKSKAMTKFKASEVTPQVLGLLKTQRDLFTPGTK
jgi:prolyl-tRNA synthetase